MFLCFYIHFHIFEASTMAPIYRWDEDEMKWSQPFISSQGLVYELAHYNISHHPAERWSGWVGNTHPQNQLICLLKSRSAVLSSVPPSVPEVPMNRSRWIPNPSVPPSVPTVPMDCSRWITVLSVPPSVPEGPMDNNRWLPFWASLG